MKAHSNILDIPLVSIYNLSINKDKNKKLIEKFRKDKVAVSMLPIYAVHISPAILTPIYIGSLYRLEYKPRRILGLKDIKNRLWRRFMARIIFLIYPRLQVKYCPSESLHYASQNLFDVLNIDKNLIAFQKFIGALEIDYIPSYEEYHYFLKMLGCIRMNHFNTASYNSLYEVSDQVKSFTLREVNELNEYWLSIHSKEKEYFDNILK